MRRSVRAIAGIMLVAGLTTAFIPGAHASVAKEKSVEAFCEKLSEIASTVPDLSGGDDALIDAARDFSKLYKKAAKAAPTPELRKAAKTISKYYARLAASGDPNSEAASYTNADLAAVEVITEYSNTGCAATGVVPST